MRSAEPSTSPPRPSPSAQADGVRAPLSPAPAGGLIVTAAGRRALEEQLATLERERDEQLPARMRTAREHGDRASADELHDILEAEGVLLARIDHLRRMLDRAQTIADGHADADAVAVGSRVTVRDVATDRVLHLRVVGSEEAGSGSVVSAGSPVGRALLGQRIGAQVEAELPGGKVRRLRLLSLSNAQDHGFDAAAGEC